MIRIKIKYPTLSKRVSRLGLARVPTEDPTDWVSGMFLITTSSGSGATRHTGNTTTTRQTQSLNVRQQIYYFSRRSRFLDINFKELNETKSAPTTIRISEMKIFSLPMILSKCPQTIL